MAIFEFSSSNGYSSFTIDFECRHIEIIDLGDENQNRFFYISWSWFPIWSDTPSDTPCEDRSYEAWDGFCKTTFQG